MVHCIGGWVIGSGRGWAAVDAAWLRAPVLEAARFRCATSRFSQTVRSAKMRRSSGTKPMPARATRYDSQPVMSMPLKTTRPDGGGRAVGDHAALVEHRDLLRDREDHLQVVLGEQ